MKQPLIIALITMLIAGAAHVAKAADVAKEGEVAKAANGFVPVGKAHSFKNAPGVSEWRFEKVRGPSSFDKIGLHHVTAGKTAAPHPEIVVLYLPGTNMNGACQPDDIKHSLALYLAVNGVDFWALDYRTHYIPPTTPVSDLKELKDWNYELFAEDIQQAVNHVREQTDAKKIFLAGFSRGVANEYLYSAMHADNVKGLIVLDGFLVMSLPSPPANDRYADDISGAHLTYDKRKTLMEMVIANPDGPAPIAKYKTARENLEHVVNDAGGIFGGHAGLANPLGGKSDAVELAKLLITYDRYWPAVQDFENPFTPALLKSLKSSGIPVIAFSSTNISPQWTNQVAESAQSTGVKHVDVTTLSGEGHLDVLCGTSCEAKVFHPIIEWLTQQAKPDVKAHNN